MLVKIDQTGKMLKLICVCWMQSQNHRFYHAVAHLSNQDNDFLSPDQFNIVRISGVPRFSTEYWLTVKSAQENVVRINRYLDMSSDIYRGHKANYC